MDSIIFDLDGTIWDSRESVAHAWNEVFKRDGDIEKEITIEDLKATMGLQIKEIGKKLLPDLDEEKLEKILAACCEAENLYLTKHGGQLYNNVEAVLKVLVAKYQLFIVSNCQSGYIEAFYKYHNLEKYFIDFENPGRTGLSKGENIKLIIERNHLKNPVYVGDTEGDLKGAKHAGIPFVFAHYGFGEVRQYDYIIDRFDQLIELF